MTGVLRLPRKLLSAGIVWALLLLLLTSGDARAQSVPAAPTIDSVTAGDGLLIVAWTASAGESGITTYDLRYIKTSDDETDDANWTVKEDVWASNAGDLEYRILLSEYVQYDVQVRAVRGSTDGMWSPTSTGTPADHSGSRNTTTDLPLNASVVGFIDSASDDDYFRITLSEGSGVFFYTTSYITGFLPATGELQNSSGTTIKSDDDDSLFRQHGQQLFLWDTLSAGTYYVKVEAPEAGYYTLHSQTVPDGGDKAGAVDVSLNGFANGILGPASNDEDWFKVELSQTTDLMLRVTRANSDVDTEGTLFGSDNKEIAVHDDSFLEGELREHFIIREKLDAGVYYLRVRSSPGGSYRICDEDAKCSDEISKSAATDPGPYMVHAEAVTAPGSSTGAARALTLGQNEAAGGRIDRANDTDYFSITVSDTTHVRVRVVSSALETNVALLDTSRREVGTLQSESDYVPGRLGGLLYGTLKMGTSYIKVTAEDTTETGGYAIVAYEDTDYADSLDRCSAISANYSDPLYGCQWHLNNTGQDSGVGAGTVGEDINVEEVWAAGNLGEGINIAIVDNGLYYDHEDLTANVNRSRNHDYTGEGDVFERYFTHGTRMAGIIAARDNSIGVRGVAPRATVYAYNWIRNPTFANLGDAMTRNMVDTAVYNNSWGPLNSPRPARVPSVWELAVDAGVSKGFGGKGVFYVFSAGNGGRSSTGDYSNLNEYANYYAVTAACATDDLGERAAFSEEGPNLWVCAPSEGDGRQGITTTQNYNRYDGSTGGTSSAAAIVSGVAALVRKANANLTWRDVKLILAASARKNDSSDSGWETGATKYGSTTDTYNYNHEYGFGVVDAKAAVDLAANWALLPPMGRVGGGSDEDLDLSILDTNSQVSDSVTVGAGIDFIEFVEVNAVFDHLSFRDLRVELVSPSSTTSVLSVPFDSAENYPLTTSFRFGSARHLGESATGNWTLRLTDTESGSEGSLLSWSITIYGHSDPLAAPTITSVAPGSTSLTIGWDVPEGASGITAYDVRHIASDATDKADDEWTVIDNAWTSGDLEETISGLTDGTQYDVQVRAVSDTVDGDWSDTAVGTPGSSAATVPTIDSARPDDKAILVSWSAPTSTTETVTAYHLRHIRNDTSSRTDSNWTPAYDAWTTGGVDLGYAITGLENGVMYDVQVRAVATSDGDWSPAFSTTPYDYGGSLDTATTLVLETTSSGRIAPLGHNRYWGELEDGGDTDYFKFELTSTQVGSSAGFWLYTTSDLDTIGVLLDSDGLLIEANDDGRVSPNPRDFFMWRTMTAGTYYLKLSGYEGAQGPYTLRLRTFTDTTSRSNAVDLPLDDSASGMVDPKGDEDYFKLVVPSDDTEVVLRSSGFFDSWGELQNNSGRSLEVNDDGYLTRGLVRQFLIRTELDTGTYYLKVKGFKSDMNENIGPFSVYATTVTEPGSDTASAQALTLGRPAGGGIDPAGDEDYFSITLSDQTYVYIRAVSKDLDLDGTLLDDSNNAVTPDSDQDSNGYGIGFTIRSRLEAGTYYIKVTGDSGADTGRYTIMASEELSFSGLVDECTSIPRSFGINDPLYGCQWHLNNDGQFRGGARQDINVEDAWPTYGTGINVAVVDDGMHYAHEDLMPNANTALNHDYTGNSEIHDPLETHGTAVAGIIAARDNDKGMRGVAPRATIYGYNLLLSNELKDEGDAMSRNASVTAISNNSWGPGDSGAPEPTNTFWTAGVQTGITDGFGGKGTFYVWAAGNGGRRGDYSNLDEYANYYAVTAACAVNHLDVRSSYSEPGSNLWVCAPSSDSSIRGLPGIATTDNGNRYRDDFGGTSAAAPIVSGVAALVRDANNALTWRDVKLVLAASARKNDPTDSGWETGALKYGSTTDRYNFNHEYGFGMVDAKAAVDLANGWTNVPTFRNMSAESGRINLTIPDATSALPGARVTSTLTLQPFVGFVEYIEVKAHFAHTSFRDLDVELVSPTGAVSKLVPHYEAPPEGRRRWDSEFRFGSARHLGEDAAGVWTLRIVDHIASDRGTLKSWQITAYGHGYVPTRPDIDEVTPGQGTLTVTWKEPDDAGSSSVTQYDLRHIRSDTTDKSDDQWTVVEDVGIPGSALSHNISDLQGRVDYDIQLRAVNSRGPGPWSPSAKTQNPIAAPSAPAITSITPGDAALAVSWSPPTNTGGEDPTSYDVRRIESSADETVDTNWTVLNRIWTSGDLRYTITGLTNSTEYDVQVRASNSAGSGDWSANMTGTPEQAHTPVTLSVEQPAVSVSEDGGSATVTLFLTTTVDQAPRSDFSADVRVTVADRDATLSTDYGSPSASTLSFEATDFAQTTINGQQRHQASKSFTVDIVDDAVDEDDEDFTIILSYATSGLPHLRGGSPTARITITDNDHVPVTLGWQNATQTVNEGAGTVTLRALAMTTKDKRPDSGFSFQATVSTSEISAEQPDDYTHVSQTATFQQSDFRRATVNGQPLYRAEKQVVVPIANDTLDEPDEDFKVTLFYVNPSLPHLQGGPATTEVYITDNDHVPVTIEWEQTVLTVAEDTGSVTLQASATTTKDKAPEGGFSFSVNATTTARSAEQNADYRRLAGTATFRQADFSREIVNGQPRYRASKEFTITVLEDTVDEEGETFTATLAYSNPGLPHLQGSSSEATITITDNDHVPVVLSWNQDEAIVQESPNSGATHQAALTAVATTTKDKMPDHGFSFDVSLNTSNGSATQPADYEQLAATFTFAQADFRPRTVNGQRRYRAEKDITVAIAHDNDVEPNETFTVTLAYSHPGEPHLQGDRATATVTITDDDVPAVSLSFEQASYTVTEGSSVSVKVTLSADPERTITIPLISTYQGGASNADYSGVPPNLIFNSGGTEQSFTFTATQDSQDDDGESVELAFGTLPASMSAVTNSVATVTIINDLSYTVDLRTTASSSISAFRGQRVTYNYTLRNAGPATSTEPALTTTLDPGTRFVSATPADLCAHSGGSTGGVVTCSFDALATAGAQTGEIVAEVTAQATSDITASFVASGGRLDRDPGNNSATGFTELQAPPQPVTDLSRTSTGNTFIELSWTKPTDNGSPITAYQLERKEVDGAYFPISPAPSAAVTTYRDEQMANETAYIYRISAINEDGGADWSNEVTATAAAPPRRSAGGGGGGSSGGRRANGQPRVDGPDRPTYPENGTEPVATYTATDPDDDDISWSLDGRDTRWMEMSREGILRFREPPDYEKPADSRLDNTYEVTLRATDDGSPPEDDIHRVRVTVTNVNEVGPVMGQTDITVEENSSGQIAQYTAQDPERNGITWSLSGPDAAFFQIDQDGNLVLFKELDFEVKSSADMSDVYKVTVVATDDGRPTASSDLDVVVKVSDLEEAPKGPLCAWVSFILEWATPDDADSLGTQSTLLVWLRNVLTLWLDRACA